MHVIILWQWGDFLISNFKVKNCFNCAFGKYDGFCIKRNDKLGYYTDCKFYSGSYIPTAVFHILGSRKHHEILEDITTEHISSIIKDSKELSKDSQCVEEILRRWELIS